jgi:hypothetical protein
MQESAESCAAQQLSTPHRAAELVTCSEQQRSAGRLDRRENVRIADGAEGPIGWHRRVVRQRRTDHRSGRPVAATSSSVTTTGTPRRLTTAVTGRAHRRQNSTVWVAKLL